MSDKPKSTRSVWGCFQWGVALFIIFVLLGIDVGPLTRGMKRASESTSIQEARYIDAAMLAYSLDHHGSYPTGKSSTEVFQKLIDENYVTDSSVFFVPVLFTGKTKPTTNLLKPENVCWDITIPLDRSSSGFLPVVFLTGFRINYVPGGNAVPLHPPWPKSDWIYDGIRVCYHSDDTQWSHSQPDGSVTNFISPDFVPDGKKYQQLTPDGPLAP